MAKTMPPMMQVMRDIGGIELPQSLVKLGTDDAPSQVAAASRNGDTPVVPAKEKGKG
jgi:flotillin